MTTAGPSAGIMAWSFTVDSSPLVSIDELADVLRTTALALYCRRHRSKYNLPPAVKIPGDRRLWFRADVVDEWIENPKAFMPKEKRGPGRPRKHPVQGGAAMNKQPVSQVRKSADMCVPANNPHLLDNR
jgi:hypothetical protein